MNSLYRFFWLNSKERGLVYALTALLGIAYASLRSLVFHGPERQVAIELLVLIVVGVCTGVALEYLTSKKGFFAGLQFGTQTFESWQYKHVFVRNLTQLGALRISAKVKYAGAIACMILLSSSRLDVSKVQAAIINQRLERAASAIEPDKTADLPSSQLKARFQKISSIANTSLENKITANPDLVEKVRNNLAETLKTVNPSSEDARRSGVAAFVALVAYARYNNVAIALNVPTILFSHGETGNSMISQVPLKNGASWWQGSPEGNTIFAEPTPSAEPVFPVSHARVVFNGIGFMGFGLGRPFVGTDNESQVVIMNATVAGASQKLDSIVWVNIKFKTSRIIYSGGPLYLGETSFENCLFEFGSDPASQKVLEQIKAAGNRPVTVVSGL